jgi:hypothetical protein
MASLLKSVPFVADPIIYALRFDPIIYALRFCFGWILKP